MTGSENPAEKSPEAGFRPRPLHLFALSALAVAQPLFDLLSRGATFFVEHDFSPPALLLFVALLLLLPLPLVLLVAALRRASPRTARGLHLAGVALFVTLLAAQVLGRRIDAAAVVAAGALLAGAAGAAAYRRWDGVRQFTSLLGLALVAVPLAFLLSPQVRGLLRGPATVPVAAAGAPEGGLAVPVVVVIFDELSLGSLLDDEHRIDAVRFPNFAALAGRSTWFRDAVAASDRTEYALPAMLTGRLPQARQLPTSREFPRTLFTALAGTHRIVAHEALTRLCPAEFNEARAELAAPSRRWSRFAGDLIVLYGHLVTPPAWRPRLPGIASAWGGFAAAGTPLPPAAAPPEETQLAPSELAPGADLFKETLAALGRDRASGVRGWISQIGRGERPGLFFLHVLLPHYPWEYTRDGRIYPVASGGVPGLNELKWTGPEHLAALAHERYLLQLGFADALLGELTRQLERQGLADAALVVTADHGVSFRPGDFRRELSPTNAGDVLPIPLFVRAPGQREGRLVDHPVSALQLLPTVLDLLGRESPWPLAEGSALRGPAATPRRVLVGGHREVEVPGNLTAAMDELRAEYRRASVAAGGLAAPLVGREVATLVPVAERKVDRLRLSGAAFFHDVDLDAPVLPVYVEGTLGELDGSFDVAIAVNGTVRAAAKPFRLDGGDLRFAALVGEEFLVAGENRVELFAVRPADSGVGFERLSGAEEPRLRIVGAAEGGRGTIEGTPEPTPILAGPMQGYFGVRVEGGRVILSGWAWDREAGRTARDILVFLRDESVATIPVSEIRGGNLQRHLGVSRPVRAGFSLQLPVSALPGLERDGLRLFARPEEGGAVELRSTFELDDVAATPASGAGESRIRSSDGRVFRVSADRLIGEIGRVGRRPDGRAGREVRGWAADTRDPGAAVRILVFRDGRCILPNGRTGEARRGTARAPAPAELARSGFTLLLADPGARRGNIRVFAVSEDLEATELHPRSAAALATPAPVDRAPAKRGKAPKRRPESPGS